ncbi:hypothetical protein, partial [Streptomyces bikiniensis]|uniref:hypothetical protein n=1 Tax=Streptomyces bikiniensis TaxID=1896 RepID=UPI001ADFA537
MTTPRPGYHCVKRFKNTGKIQDFRVPDDVTSLDVRIWGSGGGGDLGGGGGYAGGGADDGLVVGGVPVVLIGHRWPRARKRKRHHARREAAS